MPWPTPSTIPAPLTGRVLLIPDDLTIIQSVLGALLPLTYDVNWVPVGAVTPAQMAAVMEVMVFAALDWYPALVGTVFPIITSLPPPGALLCDGATYLRITYPTLYAALDSHFIVDADHFTVPDLRGRTVIGAGSGSGLTPRTPDDSLGEETHQLTTSELASHTHTYGGTLTLLTGTPPPLDAESPNPLTAVSGSTGGDVPHNNMQPSLALNYAVWAV